MYRKHEQGFLIPLAAIIVVGLGVLAIAISRISAQSASATAQEGLSAQAYYAAESAAQYAMNQLFFSASDKVTVDASCASVSGETLNFSALGLAACSSAITCAVSTAPGSQTNYYWISSEAVCGSGLSFAERKISVSAFME